MQTISVRSRLHIRWVTGMKGAPKQVEKVGCVLCPDLFPSGQLGRLKRRGMIMAWARVSLAIGGRTPKASAVSMITFWDGWRGRLQKRSDEIDR